MDVTIEGKPTKAVAQVTKQGFTFVFDRVTGKPIWPIEERPVHHPKFPAKSLRRPSPFPPSLAL